MNNRRISVRLLIRGLTIALVSQFIVYTATADSNQSEHNSNVDSSICIVLPWAYESLGKNVGAAYMTIMTREGFEDELIGASSQFARRVEIHHIVMNDGIMMMVPAQNLTVRSFTPLVLKPHGLHVMLMGLNDPLEPGDSFPMTLQFNRLGEIEIQISVQRITTSEPVSVTSCE